MLKKSDEVAPNDEMCEQECINILLHAARASAQRFWDENGCGGGGPSVRVCTSRRLAAYFADDEPLAAELSALFFVRGLIGDAEGAALIAAADRLESDSTAHHDVVYLHRGGYFAREWAALLARLVAAMRSADLEDGRARAAEPPLELAVRCVELHTYRVGGALLDADHRDNGSTITISVLLSDSERVDGGKFVTWAYDERGARAVPHDIRRGDAIILNSEKLHNVSPVTRGLRKALVLELWRQPANGYDRFS